VKHHTKPAISFTDYPDFHLVDTTGAGDCFTGAFALEMLEGRNYERAMEFSNQVGFLCITKFGAGPSIPYLNDVKAVFGEKGDI
jgi:sugar/nucleoside kinase (ribokinase family)